MTAKILALVGIDGAGKTSAIETLKDTFGDVVAFVKKEKRSNVDAVLNAFPSEAQNANDYLDGPFAVALRWAHAFDFIRFYEDEVQPLLKTKRVIVSDRWSVCSIAYSAVAPGIDQEIRDVLSCVPPADICIHLRVSPQEGLNRIRRTREPLGDEDLSLLRIFLQGYLETLHLCGSEIVNIETTSVFDTTAKVREIIGELL